jgi:phosphopantothenoylcysteine synthetase/decarboxylase
VSSTTGAEGGAPPVTCDTLVIAVTGSVGVLSMPAYVRLFRAALARDVYVIMSRSAQRFITPYSFALYTDHPVFCDTFEQHEGFKVPHIDLARRADLLLVAPATANILARCAHGICDDLISTTVVACQAPVVFVPSMNEIMWRSRVVQRNAALLRELGHHVIEPAMGFEIADNKPTFGAMPPFVEILEALTAILAGRRA